MFRGSHKMPRSLYLLVVGVSLLLVTVLLLLVTGCDRNKVSVFNDLPYQVSLWACQRDPVDFETGQVRHIDVFTPCIVRRNVFENVGCLLFPPEAFKGTVIVVSSMNTSIDAHDCPHKEHY